MLAVCPDGGGPLPRPSRDFTRWLMPLAAVLLCACGGGPASVAGRVLDDRGEPISKASVETTPETDFVSTNSRGFFVLRQRLNDVGETEPIPEGVYRIKVSKFGFQDLAFEVAVKSGPTRVTDLVMKPRTPEIEETAPEVLEERETAPDEQSVPTQGI